MKQQTKRLEETKMTYEKISDEKLDQISGGTIINYAIQPGDTLSAVASRFNVTIDQLMRWNSISNPNIVTVGQQIKVKF